MICLTVLDCIKKGSNSLFFLYFWLELDCEHNMDVNFSPLHPTFNFDFLLVNCPVGYFFSSTGCQACAEDNYQDNEAQIECVTCPSGTSTFGQTGSKGNEDCQGQLKLFSC